LRKIKFGKTGQYIVLLDVNGNGFLFREKWPNSQDNLEHLVITDYTAHSTYGPPSYIIEISNIESRCVLHFFNGRTLEQIPATEAFQSCDD
jgi:hypothetical protein